MKKHLLLYILIVGVFTFLIWYIIDQGKDMKPKAETTSIISQKLPTKSIKLANFDSTRIAQLANIFNAQKGVSLNLTVRKDTLVFQSVALQPSQLKESKKTSLDITSKESVWSQLKQNIQDPLSLLLIQIIIILAVSRVFGILAKTIGQPSVVGEMIAGIFLGPTIVGYFFPEFSLLIFPKTSMSTLKFLSQIGLAFFMFIVGMELDIEKLRNKAHNAVVISHASIVIPFFLGVLLAGSIYVDFAPANVSFLSFALFMGIAMSITAFP